MTSISLYVIQKVDNLNNFMLSTMQTEQTIENFSVRGPEGKKSKLVEFAFSFGSLATL